MTAKEKVDLKIIIEQLAEIYACLMGAIKPNGSTTIGLVAKVHGLEKRAKTELWMRRAVISLLWLNVIAMLFEPLRAALGI